MVLLTIKIKGWEGNFRADVIAFNKENKSLLVQIMNNIGLSVDETATLKEMKEISKEYDDNYPCGFKHIEGIYCFYNCLG